MPFDALTICAKNQVRKTIKRFEGTHLISLVDPDDRMPRPHRVTRGHHLVMHFDDVDDPTLPEAPRVEHVNRAFEWVARLPATARLVVHCTAGISRSTALAYGLLCHQMNNDEAMVYVQRVRPEAKPNKLMMQLINMSSCPKITCKSITDTI